jgi:hypothetical protein
MTVAAFVGWQLYSKDGYKKNFKTYLKKLGLYTEVKKSIDKEERAEAISGALELHRRLKQNGNK